MADAARTSAREAWITGIGLATSLGEGLDTHWDALQAKRVNVDTASFAPYVVHPMAPLSYDAQIPKKGDQRQMEAWQRIGTYAAGLALESAGVKGKADILSRMDMIVAAGGGERDLKVDSAVLTEQTRGNGGPAALNERLMNDLRPTLFLAQLSNLLAGNIAIVHGVTGSSRTFMGEEIAGADAARIALARIQSGQSDIALVGAAHNGERKDLLMLNEFAGLNLRDAHAPVWSRTGSAGFALGSGGAFLVIEASDHASARGATPLARLAKVVTDRARRRDGGSVTATLAKLWTALAPATQGTAIVTGATGAEPVTAEERAFLETHRDNPVRASGTAFGHLMEAQFPLCLALGALALSRRALFPGNDSAGVEAASEILPKHVVVIGAGHWSGEGMALLDAVS